jgi:hypothetical protein
LAGTPGGAVAAAGAIGCGFTAAGGGLATGVELELNAGGNLVVTVGLAAVAAAGSTPAAGVGLVAAGGAVDGLGTVTLGGTGALDTELKPCAMAACDANTAASRQARRARSGRIMRGGL